MFDSWYLYYRSINNKIDKDMYKSKRPNGTQMTSVDVYEGERIEEKIARVLENNEPITDGAPIIYTDRKDGVMPAYDIRTDRFEIATDAMDAVTKAQIAKRDNVGQAEMKVVGDNDKDSGAKSSGGGEASQSSKSADSGAS